MNLFENDNLRWKHFTGGDRFDYPINFSSALLSARPDGHIELLIGGSQTATAIFTVILPIPPP